MPPASCALPLPEHVQLKLRRTNQLAPQLADAWRLCYLIDRENANLRPSRTIDGDFWRFKGMGAEWRKILRTKCSQVIAL